MGGAFSKTPVSSDNMPLYKKIDYIASDYILSSDFKSLQHLKEKDYCNKIVVITSDILEKYLGATDILYLQQKMKKGHEDPVNIMSKKSVAFLNNDDLTGLGVTNAVKKKRMCIGIAKKYVRVAHIFASIVTAINPVYTYKDESGAIVRTPLYKKDEIPPNIKVTLENFNICENRIKTLQGAQKDAFGTEGPIIVSPPLCQASAKLDGTEKTLVDEPGIPELMQLYYDKYDYSTGEFIGMTEKTKKIYEEHVKIFNATFTGTENNDIKEFADIKLKDYNKNAYCEGNAVTSQKQYSSENVSKEQYELFTKYAEQVKTMIANANKNQATLLQIINELFTPVADSSNPNKTHYKVNSKLDDVTLEKLVKRTRELIMKLFLTCEADYEVGIKLYEAIVNTVIINATDSQIKNLEEVKENIIAESPPEETTSVDSVVDSIMDSVAALNPLSNVEEEPPKTIEQIEEEELNINEESKNEADVPSEETDVLPVVKEEEKAGEVEEEEKTDVQPIVGVEKAEEVEKTDVQPIVGEEEKVEEAEEAEKTDVQPIVGEEKEGVDILPVVKEEGEEEEKTDVQSIVGEEGKEREEREEEHMVKEEKPDVLDTEEKKGEEKSE
jgi:hypothetical protein